MSSSGSVQRVTVLISGSGSNLQALMDAAGTSRLPTAQITYVCSSRSTAYGLQRAAHANPPIPTSVCALKTFQTRNPGSTREDYDREVARRVVDSRPDLVVLAGWMHILSQEFLSILDGTAPCPESPLLQPTSASSPSAHPSALFSALPPPIFPIPIINLHPALPGQFDGAHAIDRAHAAAENGEITKTGCMVHMVVKEVDRGEPVVVREVECVKGETLQQLEERIHEIEHEIIVEGAKKVLASLRSEDR